MTSSKYRYLERVDSPADLKLLAAEELPEYCAELRRYIVEQLAENPGHLASSLGTVELTVALHSVYDTPDDKLIWDVGHQAYAHKIITGRREAFATNRKLGGLSGFPNRDESPYDAFGGGHSSVSVSAAFGIAKALELSGEKHGVVAVIGDGAMTGGLAFEGLNNAGAANTNLLVILNDNHISIDPNVGALKKHLLKITSSLWYNRLKERVWHALRRTPRLKEWIRRTGNAVKIGLLRHSNFFESLGFRYFGPVDGHDVNSLVRVLRDLRDIPGAKLLHVLTVKGKGYLPAENDQSVWHAPGRFDPETGERLGGDDASLPARYQDVFGQTLLELAREEPRIVGITPAMATGCSLSVMMEELPERCFDVGIAEGHAVTFSAGLAAAGAIPFCNIYSSFMQRAYDNVIHDVALQRLPVVLCLDRSGLVGEDGATHHGEFDLACFGCIPGLVVMSPMDECELRNMMYSASRSGKPCVIRYPRGRGAGAPWRNAAWELLPEGRGRLLSDGRDTALLTIGPVGNFGAEAVRRAAAEGISAAHYDLRYARPLDTALLDEVAGRFRRIVTVEDGVIRGGVGSAVVKYMNEKGYDVSVETLGIDDVFVKHGTPAQLYALCGYDAEGILRALRRAVK